MLHSESFPGLQGTAKLIRWFADNAEKVLGNQEFSEDGFSGMFTYEPLGVIY